jgi:hypothetical protein
MQNFCSQPTGAVHEGNCVTSSKSLFCSLRRQSSVKLRLPKLPYLSRNELEMDPPVTASQRKAIRYTSKRSLHPHLCGCDQTCPVSANNWPQDRRSSTVQQWCFLVAPPWWRWICACQGGSSPFAEHNFPGWHCERRTWNTDAKLRSD